MHRARGGFGEHGRVRFQAVHREHLPVISAGVLGEETGPVDAHALGVGAQNQLAGQAIFAVPAVDVRVDRHLLPRLKRVTSAPTSSISPIVSCPGVSG